VFDQRIGCHVDRLRHAGWTRKPLPERRSARQRIGGWKSHRCHTGLRFPADRQRRRRTPRISAMLPSQSGRRRSTPRSITRPWTSGFNTGYARAAQGTFARRAERDTGPGIFNTASPCEGNPLRPSAVPEFRAEAFNVLNHPKLGRAEHDLSNVAFGRNQFDPWGNAARIQSVLKLILLTSGLRVQEECCWLFARFLLVLCVGSRTGATPRSDAESIRSEGLGHLRLVRTTRSLSQLKQVTTATRRAAGKVGVFTSTAPKKEK